MADTSEKISQLKIDRDVDMPTRGGRWWLPAGGLLLLVLAAAWWFFGPAGSGAVLVETTTARKPPSIAAANSVLDASGYVVARRQTTVSSKVTGKVLEVLVEEGMRVEQDQVVARLDDTTQRAQLAHAIAQLKSTEAVLNETAAALRNATLERDRLRDLAERNLTSEASVDLAESNYDQLAARLETGRRNVDVAKRSVELAEDSLSNMTIRAPFAGMVVSKNAQPGEMISPVSAGGGFTRTGICTIIDTDSLEIEVDVNEAYINKVVAGQPVVARLDAYSDWQIPAEVIAVVPTADRQKATVKVRIGFLERDERVLRDMGAKVSFLGSNVAAAPRNEIEGVLIPREALRDDDRGEFVWLVNNGVVARRGVEVGGDTERAEILIVNGLRVGDTIVRSSEQPLAGGRSIKSN